MSRARDSAVSSHAPSPQEQGWSVAAAPAVYARLRSSKLVKGARVGGSSSSSSSSSSSFPRRRSVYILNIPSAWSLEKAKSFFAQFGAVEHAAVREGA